MPDVGSKLSSLSDVLLNNLANKEIISWDSSQKKWVNKKPIQYLIASLPDFTNTAPKMASGVAPDYYYPLITSPIPTVQNWFTSLVTATRLPFDGYFFDLNVHVSSNSSSFWGAVFRILLNGSLVTNSPTVTVPPTATGWFRDITHLGDALGSLGTFSHNCNMSGHFSNGDIFCDFISIGYVEK